MVTVQLLGQCSQVLPLWICHPVTKIAFADKPGSFYQICLCINVNLFPLGLYLMACMFIFICFNDLWEISAILRFFLLELKVYSEEKPVHQG